MPSEIDKGIKEAEEARRAVHRLGDRKETLYHNIQDHSRHLTTLVAETSELTKQINELECLSRYLNCLVHVQTIR